MKKMLIAFLCLSSASTYAKEITTSNTIEYVLSKNSELVNLVMAKSLSLGKLIKIDRLVTENTGNIWSKNGSGYDCTLSIRAFSKGRLVAQISRTYSDSGCPRF